MPKLKPTTPNAILKNPRSGPPEVWLSVAETAELLGITARAVRKSILNHRYIIKTITANGGQQSAILLTSLPVKVQNRYWESLILRDVGQETTSEELSAPDIVALEDYREDSPELSDEEVDAEIYASAPEYAKKKADKYLAIFRAIKDLNLKGKKLKKYLSDWNRDNPAYHTSYARLMLTRKRYLQEGVSAILAGYGKNAGYSSVDTHLFRYFKSLYLKEGGPSAMSCWYSTLGFARESGMELNITDIPCVSTFIRRLRKESPEEAIYLARNGEAAWSRRYGSFADRNYDKLQAGECWVGDHAQIDVAVLMPNDTVCFPWVTAWQDFKTGKWLGWFLHAEAPNSDHIFQAFYFAARDFGLPKAIYIDNGKDYRCRDFAGGRNHRFDVDENKASSLTASVGVMPYFALPYNAKAKVIERSFLTNKVWLSKHLPGYRGGNITERPEKLKLEIKNKALLRWDDFQRIFNSYITDILNRKPRTGRVHKMQSPDQLWDRECREIRKMSSDALRLFCMRTTVKPLRIGPNGVNDSALGIKYWAEFMAGLKGDYVYLRRDPQAWQEAWVFDAKDGRFLGKAQMTTPVAAMATDNIDKAQLSQVLAANKQRKKTIKAYAQDIDNIPTEQILRNMASGVSIVNNANGWIPNQVQPPLVTTLANTEMDQAVRKAKKQEELEQHGSDLSSLARPTVTPITKKTFQFEWQLRQYQAEQAAQQAEAG